MPVLRVPVLKVPGPGRYSSPMIIAVVRFTLPAPLSPAEASAAFASSAEAYRGVDGLRHKHYLLSDDGMVAGGVYEWETRTAAELMFTDEWRQRIVAKYGSDPTVEYFVSPVQVSPSAVSIGPLDSAIAWVAEHTRRYVETGGSDGYDWRGFPTMVLTTTGRRSGTPRRNALIFGRAPERRGDHRAPAEADLILIASYGGRPQHPLWYTNLVAEPRVAVQIRDVHHDGVAEIVEDPADRAELWAQMAAIYPPYDEYQAKTDRRIPVIRVHLTPTA